MRSLKVVLYGEAQTDAYLRLLREDCGLDVAEAEESRDLRRNCRRLRNAFAHGAWSAVEQDVNQMNLRQAFGSVASILEQLEQAYLANNNLGM